MATSLRASQFARNHEVELAEVIALCRTELGKKKPEAHTMLSAGDAVTLRRRLHIKRPQPTESSTKKEVVDEVPGTEIVLIDDMLPEIIMPRSKTRYPLRVHPDVIEKLSDKGSDHLGPRATLALAKLAAEGRTGIVKGTKGAAINGWRRSPLGGNGGSHYYLWWAPRGAPPLGDLSEELPRNAIVVGAIRHHDDLSPLSLPPTPADFYALEPAELLCDGGALAPPWTKEQLAWSRSTNPVRLLDGYPGAGKTTCLQLSIQARGGERVLYLTWSDRLSAQARDWLDTYAAEDTQVEVLAFADMLTLFGGDAKRDEEAVFIAAAEKLPRSVLGTWVGHLRELYCEVRANVVGSALPDRPATLAAPDRALLSKPAYLAARKNALGKAAASLYGIVEALDSAERPVESLFPSLQRAFRAAQRLLAGDVPTEFQTLDRIVVDEVQDLTRVEALVPILLAVAVSGLRDDSRLPFLNVAGDEGQTLHPTGFRWGWFKDLLTERIPNNPHEERMTANLRSPRKIAKLVNESAKLYDIVDKGRRPSGLRSPQIEDVSQGHVYVCRAAAGEDLTALVQDLEELENVAVIYLTPDVPARLASANTSFLLDPESAKGLDFQAVCIVDAGAHLAELHEACSSGRGQLRQQRELWARRAVDRLRVALSRPTDALLFLEISGDEDAAARLGELCKSIGPVPVDVADVAATLTEDDDIDTRVLNRIDRSRDLVDGSPGRALQLASGAVRLLGDPAVSGSVTDPTARRDAHLNLITLTLLLARRGTISGADRRTRLNEAIGSAKEAQLGGLGMVMALHRDRDAAGDRRKPVAFYEAALASLRNVDPVTLDPRLESEFETLRERWAAELKDWLDLAPAAALPLLPDLHQLLAALGAQNALAEAERVREMHARAFFEVDRFHDALAAVEAMERAPPQLFGEVLEALGREREAAPHFESSELWVDAMRCWREVGAVLEAAACADKVADKDGAAEARWLRDVQFVVSRRPAGGFTLGETEWLRQQGNLALGAATGRKRRKSA